MSEPPATSYFFVHVFHVDATVLLELLRNEVQDHPRYPQRGVDDDMAKAKLVTTRLLEQPRSRLEAVRAFQPHMPYCVATMLPSHPRTITIVRDPVERVLAHVLRLAARTGREDLAAVYRDGTVHDWWMVNHQTRVFSLTSAECDAWDEHAMHLISPSSPAVLRDIPMDVDRLHRAQQNLDTIDVVATADRPDILAQLLTSRFGWQPSDAHQGSSSVDGRLQIDDDIAALKDEIRRENALDQELYEYAQRLMLERAARA